MVDRLENLDMICTKFYLLKINQHLVLFGLDQKGQLGQAQLKAQHQMDPYWITGPTIFP